MNGAVTESLASSKIDALPGLSRWNTRKVPPCFGSSAVLGHEKQISAANKTKFSHPRIIY